MRAWLSNICELEKQGKVRAAMDILFQDVDELLCEGCFEECDELLKDAVGNDLSENIMIGLLTITSAASEHLPSREAFFNHVKDKVGNPDVLLRGSEAPND